MPRGLCFQDALGKGRSPKSTAGVKESNHLKDTIPVPTVHSSISSPRLRTAKDPGKENNFLKSITERFSKQTLSKISPFQYSPLRLGAGIGAQLARDEFRSPTTTERQTHSPMNQERGGGFLQLSSTTSHLRCRLWPGWSLS